MNVSPKPHEVVGLHSELLQLSDSRQISSLQLLQSRTSKPQPPQPEQPLKHGTRAQAAGGEEGTRMWTHELVSALSVYWNWSSLPVRVVEQVELLQSSQLVEPLVVESSQLVVRQVEVLQAP